MQIDLPELSLVALVGISASGKSTFARAHFRPTEVLSSDAYRAAVADEEHDQSATQDAFALLHFALATRLRRGKLTVVDATNVRAEDRAALVRIAREHHVLPVAIVLELPLEVCEQRNAARGDRAFGAHVLRGQHRALRAEIRDLEREGFRRVFRLRSADEVAAATVARVPLWNDKKQERGPFDIVGDVHGCFDELCELLETLGYQLHRDETRRPGDWAVTPPRDAEGRARKAVFLGDLVDRGPASPAVLRLVRGMIEAGNALLVPGNHEVKLLKKLEGKNVRVAHGLAQTLEQLEAETPEFRASLQPFLRELVSHYVLDGGKLIVAHAGLREEMHGRGSGRVREFCLYGETTGEIDEYGLPVRANWALDYRGRARVVYGHTPVLEAEWLNGTICIDTGCVFGGKLTALRYPENELVSVPARAMYYEPIRPLAPPAAAARTAQQEHDDLLHLEDVTGKRSITTRLQRHVTIRAENAAAALEAMSRFAADPRWLIYLPPTMSPCETSRKEERLEDPAEAFAYFRAADVERVICEEKHMGSRAVIVLCRDEQVARTRFGVASGELGLVATRTGRRFFGDPELERAFLERLRDAAAREGLFDELASGWLCLDAELLPWSAKARELLREQYAPVGAAGRAALQAAALAVERTEARLGAAALGELRARVLQRAGALERYVEAYGRYCWEVASLDDWKLAPFHLLASEGAVHVERDHLWHLGSLARLAERDPLCIATRHRVVELADEGSVAAASAWWEELTSSGGEGMVVKPLAFLARSRKGLVQPAVKVRGPEYLRIIYGPEYDLPENLARLRSRNLRGKRALALRELALGIEALERFVRREPLRAVHECVFGVLALESEPIDPRL
ncbi:MAG: polynucleotide kinase-phosphatase [Planctomycetes bacterium]|nr:polynucleotide kinase-phosphatase [Planctomycetota bacterium]